MKTILSILTAAAVAGHALFGCCWHRDHHVEDHGSCAVMDAADCDDHPGTSHDCPAEKHRDYPAGPAHHHCDGGFTWIPSGKIQIDHVLTAMPTFCVAILPALLDSTPGNQTDYLAAGPLEQAPPVRRHLLLQVLLT